MSDAPADDLLARCRDKGYTPGKRDADALLALWRAHERDDEANAKLAKLVVQALSRGEQGVARKLERGFDEAGDSERAMRLRVLARIARRVDVPTFPARLDAALHDAEPRVVREAARAIAKLAEDTGKHYEDELIRIVERADLPEQRAAVEALGLVGGDRALTALASLDTSDADLARRVARARVLLERRSSQAKAGELRLDAALAQTLRVQLRCRGAARLVAEEARARLGGGIELEPDPRDERALSLSWSRAPSELQALRTALGWGLVFTLPSGPDLAARVVVGLAQPALVGALQTLTDGEVRFRLHFARAGSRRALVWSIAQTLAANGSPLRNDSRGVNWSVEVDEGRARLTCRPHGADDRFAYRVADIPAASHPTMAAMMARVALRGAGLRDDELIWDPYCGCGAELIECSRLAPQARLLGTDRNPQAIAAARANVDAAELDSARIRLAHTDVYTGSPEPGSVAVIITNPPMGRRASIPGGLHGALQRFVEHAAQVLRPGGRMVWVTPAARVSGEAGAALGLRVRDHGTIDMSGLRVVLQELVRP